jgi:hypothetical protein
MVLHQSRTDAITIAEAAVLAVGGLLIIRSGDSAGWFLLLACSFAAALVLIKPFVPSADRDIDPESLDISPWGVRRYNLAGMHEAVSWSDLREVAVVTAAEDAEIDDVYLVLRGRTNDGVIVPHSLAVESGILSELHLRLSEFDSQAFVDALACTAEKVFVLWRAPDLSTPRPDTNSATPIRFRTAS